MSDWQSIVYNNDHVLQPSCKRLSALQTAFTGTEPETQDVFSIPRCIQASDEEIIETFQETELE